MDCSVSIDWLRFQVESTNSRLYEDLLKIIDLPFLPKGVLELSDGDEELEEIQEIEGISQIVQDKSQNRGFLALNRYWDKVWEFQGSQVGFLRSISDLPHRFFVDLTGSALSFLPNNAILNLLQFAVSQKRFIGNRIDIALDFPVGDPPLSCRPWRDIYNLQLIKNCRTFKDVNSIKKTDSATTVYLNSRESEVFVRFYDKDIEGFKFDRWETEFKRDSADWILREFVKEGEKNCLFFLYRTAISSVKISPDPLADFFKQYKSCRFAEIKPLRKSPHIDIERTAAFLRRLGPSLAAIRELEGSDRFAEFCASAADCGKPRMRSRHWQMVYAAKVFGYSILSLILVLGLQPAIASPPTCPVRSPSGITDQLVRKFPIDIVLPNETETAYLNSVGDGCFAINSGMNFDRVCLPGQIVRALQPIVVLAVGLRFIFSDG